MTSIMRRTVRGTAAGLGALAIVAGTAACGGILGGGEDGADGGTGTGTEEGQETQEEDGSSDTEGEDAGAAEDTEDSGTEEDAQGSDDSERTEETDDPADADAAESDDAGSSEEDGDDAAEALSEDDLTAVGDTYYEFLEAAAASDGEAACSLITNPGTDEPLKSGEVALCAKGFEGETEKSPIDPSMMDAIDRSMVEAVDNGDGTAGVTLMGQDAGVIFVSVDGSWYMDGSQFI